jgi:hypothetical protein
MPNNIEHFLLPEGVVDAMTKNELCCYFADILRVAASEFLILEQINNALVERLAQNSKLN